MNAAGTSSTTIVNAMTIDVEDYFHVSVFDGLLPRDQWATLDSRVCDNTERLLGVLHEAGVTATKPATSPEANPKAVGLPRWAHSAAIQLRAAAAAAT